MSEVASSKRNRETQGGNTWQCINKHDNAHVAHSLHTLVQRRRNDIVTICEGRRRTGFETFQSINELSRGIVGLGIQPGERVAILALNSELYLDCLVAIPMAGAIISPLNCRWSPEETRAAISKINASVFIFDSSFSSLWTFFQRSCSSIRFGIAMDKNNSMLKDSTLMDSKLLSMDDLLALGRCSDDVAAMDFRFSPNGICFICFTSGTTGEPKGVSLTHASLISQSMAKLIAVKYNQKDIYLHAAPLFHIGGATSAFAMLMACGTHVFLPKFRTQHVIRCLQNDKITSFIAVPAMIIDILLFIQKEKEKKIKDKISFTGEEGGEGCGKGEGCEDAYHRGNGVMTDECSGNRGGEYGDRGNRVVKVMDGNKLGLKREKKHKNEDFVFFDVDKILIGGGLLDEFSFRSMSEIFPLARIVTAYGMTEACSSITFHLLRFISSEMTPQITKLDQNNHSIYKNDHPNLDTFCMGQPAPHVQVMIAKSSHALQSDVEEAGVGEEGEILTRGLHVMNGYWGDAVATSAVLTCQGWLRTGDVGYLDQKGNLYLMGRRKDVIKSGGENVHASEVENVLKSHPAVLETCVVGLVHPRLGEEVCALLVLKKEGWESDVKLSLGSGVNLFTNSNGMAHTSPSMNLTCIKKGNVDDFHLKRHCMENGLSRYKIPKLIFAQTDLLPKTSTGKVKKDAVKKILTNLKSRLMTHHDDNDDDNLKRDSTFRLSKL